MAVGVMAGLAPAYLPDAPHWIWGIAFWLAGALLVGAILWGCWPWVLKLLQSQLEKGPAEAPVQDDDHSDPERVPLVAAPQESRPDVFVLDALHYLAFGSWERLEWDDMAENADSLNNATHALKQAAWNGEIQVWGRESAEGGPLVAIPADHWGTHEIDFYGVLKGMPEAVKSDPISQKPDRMTAYHHLMTDRAGGEELRLRQSRS